MIFTSKMSDVELLEVHIELDFYCFYLHLSGRIRRKYITEQGHVTILLNKDM